MDKLLSPSRNSKLFFQAGLTAPLLFIFTAILGGLLRPGYNHMADTISELFTRGSPNKLILDILHSTYALLLSIFGTGLLIYTKNHPGSKKGAVFGSWLYILMSMLSFTTAVIFPQDPWGTTPTFHGQMHIYLSGILSLITLIAMALIGSWCSSSRVWPNFRRFTWIIIFLSISSAVIYTLAIDTPYMGLMERITALVGFSWTLSLSYWLIKRGSNMKNAQMTIQLIKNRDLEWAQAHLDLNLIVIEDIMSEQYQQRQPDGTYRGKADLLASYSSGDRFWEIAESTDHHVQLAGNLAILIGRWHGRGINSSKSFDYKARFLSIYRHEEGSWRMILDVSIPETNSD